MFHRTTLAILLLCTLQRALFSGVWNRTTFQGRKWWAVTWKVPFYIIYYFRDVVINIFMMFIFPKLQFFTKPFLLINLKKDLMCCLVFQRWLLVMSPPLPWMKMSMIFRILCKCSDAFFFQFKCICSRLYSCCCRFYRNVIVVYINDDYNNYITLLLLLLLL